MAHGIENLAVDYITGNLYWTDSDYKWIMVANKEFRLNFSNSTILYFGHLKKCDIYKRQ